MQVVELGHYHALEVLNLEDALDVVVAELVAHLDIPVRLVYHLVVRGVADNAVEALGRLLEENAQLFNLLQNKILDCFNFEILESPAYEFTVGPQLLPGQAPVHLHRYLVHLVDYPYVVCV